MYTVSVLSLKNEMAYLTLFDTEIYMLKPDKIFTDYICINHRHFFQNDIIIKCFIDRT